MSLCYTMFSSDHLHRPQLRVLGPFAKQFAPIYSLPARHQFVLLRGGCLGRDLHSGKHRRRAPRGPADPVIIVRCDLCLKTMSFAPPRLAHGVSAHWLAAQFLAAQALLIFREDAATRPCRVVGHLCFAHVACAIVGARSTALAVLGKSRRCAWDAYIIPKP